mmetsp:Transcript_15713/g.23087  ORF Transcript_15713/g.23087 Transcript_15713/m.23087 type:complete len:404 (-) Transcript_15713:435-1646(-)
MLFKTNEIIEFGGLFVGHYVLPVALPHSFDRGLHELAIDTSISVGNNIQVISPVLDRIPVIFRPHLHLLNRSARRLNVKQMNFRSCRRSRIHDEEAAAARLVDVEPEELVIFNKQALVLCLGLSQLVAPHFVRAVFLVHCCVKELCVRFTPHNLTRTALYLFLLNACCQISNDNVVRLIPSEVNSESKKRVVGAHFDLLHVAVALAFAKDVMVEYDLLLAHGLIGARLAALAAVDRIGETLDRARIIDVGSMCVRNLLVGLLGMRDKLFVDCSLHASQRLEFVLKVSVLAVEVRDHRMIFALVVSQPVQVIVFDDGRVHWVFASVFALNLAEAHLVDFLFDRHAVLGEDRAKKHAVLAPTHQHVQTISRCRCPCRRKHKARFACHFAQRDNVLKAATQRGASR